MCYLMNAMKVSYNDIMNMPYMMFNDIIDWKRKLDEETYKFQNNMMKKNQESRERKETAYKRKNRIT